MTTKKVQRGLLFRADGIVSFLKPENGKKFEYPELSAAVGGFIEGIIPTKSAVPFNSGYPSPAEKPGKDASKVSQVWANEEGLIDSLPLNPHTTTVANMTVYKLNDYPSYWRISGDVIAIYNVPVDRLDRDVEAKRVTVRQAKEQVAA